MEKNDLMDNINNKIYREFNLKNLSINLSRCDNFLDQNNSIEEKTSYVDGLVTKFPNQEYFLTTLLPDNFAGSIDDNDIHTNTDQIGYYQVLQPVIASDLDSEGIMFNELSTDNEGCSSIVISLQEAPDSQLYYLPVSFVDDVDGMESPDGCELSQSQSERLQTVLNGSKTDKNVGENSSKICVKTNTLVKGLSSTSDISSQSEINLQNDVMLGSKLIVSDDDNYVEELMNFLPVKSDGLNEVATDLSHTELGFEWHGDMEWNLDSTTANENGHVFDIEHSNDEFSKKMKEEYTASVIKNSLIHLKKKISGIKSLKKLDDTGPSDVKKVEVLNGSQVNCNKQKVLKKEGLLRKRKLSTSDEPAAKIMKNCKSSFGMSPNATSLSRKTKTDKGTERPAVEVVNRSSQKFLTCRGPNCSQRSQEGSSYCGPACIEAHVSLSLKLLGDDGKTLSRDMNNRVVVIDRRSGKLLTGPTAPTPSSLLSFIQKHQTYEVLQPNVRDSVHKKLDRHDINKNKVNSSNKPKQIISETHQRSLSSTTTATTKKSNIDSLRIVIRKNFLQCLSSKMNDTTMVTLPELKHLSIDLENELYKQYNSTNQIYQQHYLKLLNILKISSDKVLNGEESPISLVKKARCMSDDLLNNIDTTYKHDQHVYDINCQVCNPSRNVNKNSETVGSKLNPTKSSFKLPDETLSSNVSDVNCAFNAIPSDVSSTTDIDKPKTKEAFEDELILKSKKNENDGSFNNRSFNLDKNVSSPITLESDSSTEKVWSGNVCSKDLNACNVDAYRTSGNMTFVEKLLPKNLSILGRISYEAIEEYIAKIKSIYFNSKEIAVICFNYIGNDKKEKSDFQALFEYLNNKKRCAVIGSIGTLIKDMYLWPLHSTSPIPSLLVPFDGPGLDVNRGDVLLGIIVQQVSNAVSNAVSIHTDSVITDPTEDVETIVKKYKKQQDCQDEHDIKQSSLIDTQQGTEEAIDDINNGVDETIHLDTTSISESLNARFDLKCHNSQADSTEAAMNNLSVSLENIPLPPDTKVGTTSTDSSINTRCDKIIEHILVDKNSISHPKEITIDVSSNTKFDKKKVETNPQILNKTHARTSTEELLTSLNSLIENYIAAQTVGTTDSNDTATNITGSKNDRIINSNTDGRGSVDNDQIRGAETSVHLNENSCKINTYNPNLPNNLLNCNITKDQQILMKQALRFVKMTNVNDNPDGCHTKCDNSSYASPIQRNDIFGQHFFHDNGYEMVSEPSFKPITIEYNHHRQPDHSSSLDNDHHYMFPSQVPLNYKPQNYHSVSSQSRSQSDLCHQQPNYGSNKTYLDSDPTSSSNKYLHFEKYGKNQQKRNDFRKNHHGHNHQPLGHQQNFTSSQKINTNSNRRYNFTDKKPFRYQKY